MCHEWWLRRGSEEGEASRRLWDEFEDARPLRDPEVTEEEPEVTLETRDPMPLPADTEQQEEVARGSQLRPRRLAGARRGAPLFG
jgi:hypothetical protein